MPPRRWIDAGWALSQAARPAQSSPEASASLNTITVESGRSSVTSPSAATGIPAELTIERPEIATISQLKARRCASSLAEVKTSSRRARSPRAKPFISTRLSAARRSVSSAKGEAGARNVSAMVGGCHAR